MESTPHPAAATPAAPRPVAPTSLAAAFAAVPDPRRMASVTYPRAAVLALAVAALLAGQRSVVASTEWGSRQDGPLLAALGFHGDHVPCQSTLPRRFRHLDGDALAAALSAHVAPAAVPVAALQGVAIDGKAQRGRLRFPADGRASAAAGGGPIHTLSAVCHASGLVLAHEPITAGTTKAEVELTVAPALLARIDWRGRVLTGDARFCQRELCRQVAAGRGDYLLLVTENRPALRHAIALLFDPPGDLDPLPLLDRREARTVERGHGRTDERRHTGPGSPRSSGSSGHGARPGRTTAPSTTASPASRPRGPTRPGCSPCAAATGPSRTSSIATRTPPSARTPASSTSARDRPCWRCCATPR